MASRPGPDRGEGASAWLAAAGFLAFGVAATPPLALAPRPGGPVAALFPPWWDARQAFEAAVLAQAVTLRLGALPALLVVADAAPDRDDAAAEGSGLAGRLRTAGAWLVLDARLLGGCSPAAGSP